MKILLVKKVALNEDEINTLKRAHSIIREIFEEEDSDNELRVNAGSTLAHFDILMKVLEKRGYFR